MIKNSLVSSARYMISGLMIVSVLASGSLASVVDDDPDPDPSIYMAKLNPNKQIPVEIQVKEKPEVELQISTDSPLVFKQEKSQRISFKTGLSNYQLKQKKIAQRKAKRKAKRLAKLAKRQRRAATGSYAPVVKRDRRTNFTGLYKRAGKRFGISWKILAAVHSVETGQSGNTTIGSYAGARGPMQFIPSTWNAYAVDGDRDGVASIYDVDDAVHTAARYLAANGGQTNIRRALWHYNHANWYVNKVIGIARGWGYGA